MYTGVDVLLLLICVQSPLTSLFSHYASNDRPFGSPPPAHMGIPPVHIDPKGKSTTCDFLRRGGWLRLCVPCTNVPFSHSIHVRVQEFINRAYVSFNAKFEFEFVFWPYDNIIT